MISYAKYKTKPSILEYLQVSQLFWMIPKHTQSFREFRIFLQGSRNFHDKIFLISR